MLNNIFKSIIILIVVSFFVIVFNYYFSEKNKNLIKQNRSKIESNLEKNIAGLPILKNDTNNVINFNSGFDNSNKQNYKRNFWELFK